MDKKAKKQLDVLRQKQQNLQKQLAGAKKQSDDPGEVQQLEQELIRVAAEIEKLKNL